MTNVNATGGQSQVDYYNELKDEMGGPHMAREFADHFPEMEQEIQNLGSAFHDRIADLKDQLANTDDPATKLSLEQEISKLEVAEADFRSDVEGIIDELGAFARSQLEGLAQAPGDFIAKFKEATTDFRQTVVDSYDNFGTCAVPETSALDEAKKGVVDRETVERLRDSPMIEETDGVDETDGADQTDGADKTDEVDSADESSSSEAEYSTDELLDALQNDPDAFRDMMSEMDGEARQEAMFAVQNQLQQINQTFQMMSQFSQVMHDTQKAIIQNMRV